MDTKYPQSGFTLLEIILVTAMMVAVATSGVIMVQSILTSDARDTAMYTVARAMRRAQIAALTMRYDGAWGVNVSADAATVFRGPSYADRQQSYDEELTFPSAVTITGDSEVIMLKGTGLPDSASTVTVGVDNETRRVSINAEGAISYGP